MTSSGPFIPSEVDLDNSIVAPGQNVTVTSTGSGGGLTWLPLQLILNQLKTVVSQATSSSMLKQVTLNLLVSDLGGRNNNFIAGSNAGSISITTAKPVTPSSFLAR